MIDNAVLITSHYNEKFMIFYENFEQKGVLGLLEKDQYEANKFLQVVKQGSHLSNIF